MRHYFKVALFSAMVMMSCSAEANWFADIVNRIEQTNAINTNILASQMQSLGVQQDMLTSQQNIEGLMKQVHESVIGNYGWGNYQFHDYQSYGDHARDWNSVMHMAEGGHGDGALGEMMNDISNQFPSDRGSYNRSVSDANSQKYYALKSQTILAARAASELDYNKIQDQINYQQMLQQQIERVNDLKGAVDLNNRIQVEGNLINLEILRQVALLNQQQAISDQATVNTALTNARFLTK